MFHARFHDKEKTMERSTRLDSRYVNHGVILPYGLTAGEVEEAVAETYRLFHGINDYLVGGGFRPLE
jgi:RNase P/RNase MRP subunit POP5